MKNIIYFLKRIIARADKVYFILFALCKARLFRNRKLKILFSNHEGLKQYIKNGFRFTQHKITFAEFSPSNIQNYDLVVPLYIRDLKYLNAKRHLIVDNQIPIPSLECIQLCDDKYLLNRALIENGFGTCIPKMGSEQNYPYIIKKRIDYSSKNCHIIYNEQEELSLPDVLTSPEYFRQAFIPGSFQYATHIIMKNKNIMCNLNMEYVYRTESPIQGKDKLIYCGIPKCRYLDLFSSVLASIGFEGLCCIDYKILDNSPYILEINPRFGGSLAPYFSSLLEIYRLKLDCTTQMD